MGGTGSRSLFTGEAEGITGEEEEEEEEGGLVVLLVEREPNRENWEKGKGAGQGEKTLVNFPNYPIRQPAETIVTIKYM